MNVERIRDRLREAPFRPFAVVTSSGQKHPVPHTDFIVLTQRVVVVAHTNGATTGIDPLHVVALEDIAARENGGRGKRARRS